jgi:serine/threonine protein kinase
MTESEERHTRQRETDPGIQHDNDFLEDRKICEFFANRVLEAFGEQCISVLFLPWTQGDPPPAGIVCPTSNGVLSMGQIREAMRGKQIVVCPCTFKYGGEENAARQIVAQLQQLQDVCVLAAHLLQADMRADRQYTERTGRTLQRIIATDVDDVLLDPTLDPGGLKCRIKVAHHSWTVNRRHLGGHAQQARPTVVDEIRELESTHQQLLWKDIPQYLMPNFSPLNTELVETENGVGSYTFTAKLDTKCGIVYEASGPAVSKVAIKVIEKEHFATPGEVEAINREYCFLKTFLDHPNVVRAGDFLHATMNIYICLDWAGPQNLTQYLTDQPGWRMEPDDALACFKGIASGLAHCHEKDIAHRNISSDHVVVKILENGTVFPTLIDFRTATVSKPGVQSRCSSCGKLPFMAPEMLVARPCAPMPADCWSLGVLLLEMAGGLGSFFAAVNVTDEEVERLLAAEIHRLTTANRIQAYFNTAGNHEAALARLHGVKSEAVVEILSGLVQSIGHRLPVRQVAAARRQEESLRIETITSEMSAIMRTESESPEPP